jgi:hypothetical protein
VRRGGRSSGGLHHFRFGVDTAPDNVSSPRPERAGACSEDTRIRTPDNGGYARFDRTQQPCRFATARLGTESGLPIITGSARAPRHPVPAPEPAVLCGLGLGVTFALVSFDRPAAIQLKLLAAHRAVHQQRPDRASRPPYRFERDVVVRAYREVHPCRISSVGCMREHRRHRSRRAQRQKRMAAHYWRRRGRLRHGDLVIRSATRYDERRAAGFHDVHGQVREDQGNVVAASFDGHFVERDAELT